MWMEKIRHVPFNLAWRLFIHGVTRGLDPRVHLLTEKWMDARVKPAHDDINLIEKWVKQNPTPEKESQ